MTRANTQDPYYLLLGPTASGKTQWALDFLSGQNVEVVSVDSCQVYRELSVGSAKVSPEEQALLPHHLVDCVSVRESYDVARYLSDAKNAHNLIRSRGLSPFYLGGSMLYADKIMHGLNDVPGVPKEEWIVLERLREKEGLEHLWQELLQKDPSYETRLHRNDRQRIIRALAVLRHTGKPLYSYWQETTGPEVHLAMIIPESRSELYASISLRVDYMLANGIIEETERWFEGQSDIPYQALRSVGYRQTWAYLHGDIAGLDLLKEAIVAATFYYVKQQITWMKRWINKAELVVRPGELAPLANWFKSQRS